MKKTFFCSLIILAILFALKSLAGILILLGVRGDFLYAITLFPFSLVYKDSSVGFVAFILNAIMMVPLLLCAHKIYVPHRYH